MVRAMKLLFTVYGVPIPQGSMKAFTPKGWTRPILTSDNKKTKPWRQEVAGAALEAMQRYGFEKLDRSVPVTLTLNFAFSKPKSTKRTVVAKTTKPDADKLARSILDSLTGIAFEDDSQVTELHVFKYFGDPSGVTIEMQGGVPSEGC